MRVEKIRPVPKYILKRIYEKDLTDYPQQDAQTRYYSYLTKNDGELVKITVAVRNKKHKWYHKQCAVHGIHSERCFAKDMCFSMMGGYHVGWFAEGLYPLQKWYEDGEWGWGYDNHFDMPAPVVNFDYLQKLPQYRYSAVEQYTNTQVLQYLRLYEKYPFMEYLVKSGLTDICMSKQILNQIKKDKNFPKWLIQHKNDIIYGYYYIEVILKAYKTGKPLNLLQEQKAIMQNYIHKEYYKEIVAQIPNVDRMKLIKYLSEKDIRLGSYKDYITACTFLNLDMTEAKNLFPHDFTYWHDTRVNEYRTAKALADKKRKETFDKTFTEIAEKYLPLQHSRKGNYIAIIAKSQDDLVAEGDALHHCVGHMGYGQKFVDEKSLIFFIRLKNEPETPYVTIEYSLATHKILQIHGIHNSHPDEKTTKYINNIWLPYANKQIKALAA